MEMINTRTVPASVETVWAALNDPETLKACLPGCEAIAPDGDSAYRVAVLAKIGPVSAKFSGRMQFADVDPPRSYTLSFNGQGAAAGFAKGEAKVSLASGDGGASTVLSYIVKAQVGGKLAQLGSHLVEAAANKLAEDCFARFAELAAARAGLAAAAAPPPVSPAVAGYRWRGWAVVTVISAVIGALLYMLFG